MNNRWLFLSVSGNNYDELNGSNTDLVKPFVSTYMIIEITKSIVLLQWIGVRVQ